MARFLGFDASTQSFKATVIDTDSGSVVAGSAVNFGRELPEYGAPEGVLSNPDPLVRQAPVAMWLDALELLLSKLSALTDLGAISGISGAAQQHGTVCMLRPFPGLDPAKNLHDNLKDSLSTPLAPIWQDKSTSRECHELQTRFGAELAARTGSPAVERFSAAQIRKFSRVSPELYHRTRTVHLVSSFLCSVLCGTDAPIDYGDGAGMNLLNLTSFDWDGEIVDFCAPGLAAKLPPAVPPDTIAGHLNSYFAKYGLPPGIPVNVFTGDNPASLAGAGGTESHTAVISLGTSNTFFAPLEKFAVDPAGYGHIFGSPAGGLMSLICFANGSLAQEHLRNDLKTSWEYFDSTALELTRPGNSDRLMTPYWSSEITPLVLTPQVRRNYPEATPAEEIRALLESQALSMRLHSQWQGGRFSRLRITGGGSRSPGFRQILADVFQAPAETLSVADSAALGAAMRAAESIAGIPFAELYKSFSRPESVTPPRREYAGLYADKLAEYADWEKRVLAELADSADSGCKTP